MGSSQKIYIGSGEQVRTFAWGAPGSYLTTTGAATTYSLPMYKESPCTTFQGIVAGTSGAQTATVVVQCSNDDNTGRGYIIGGANAPSVLVATTSASPTLTANGFSFPSYLTGATIYAPGVPNGTTVSSVAAGGATITMSGNATATATVQCTFYANYWCSTVLGTLSLSGTPYSTDGFTTAAPWRYVRAGVTAISGTGAAVTVLMGV